MKGGEGICVFSEKIRESITIKDLCRVDSWLGDIEITTNQFVISGPT